MWKRVTRAVPAAPWLTLSGTVALLLGLSWDLVVHRLDRSLAAREGILTLANPGHALVATGLGLTVVGSVLFLLERVGTGADRSASQRTMLRLGLLGFVALVAVSGGLSAWSSRSLGVGHTHAAVAIGVDRCTATVATPGGHGDGAAHRHEAAPPQTASLHGHVDSPDTMGAGHGCTAVASAD